MSFGVRVDLTTCLYLVFDAESEKNIFRSLQEEVVENFAHFEKLAFFEKKQPPSSFTYFST